MSLKEKVSKDLQGKSQNDQSHTELINQIIKSYPVKTNEFMGWVIKLATDAGMKPVYRVEKVRLVDSCYSCDPIRDEVSLRTVELVHLGNHLTFKTDVNLFGNKDYIGKIDIRTNMTGWERKFDLSQRCIFVAEDTDATQLKLVYEDSRSMKHELDQKLLEQLIEAILIA